MADLGVPAGAGRLGHRDDVVVEAAVAGRGPRARPAPAPASGSAPRSTRMPCRSGLVGPPRSPPPAVLGSLGSTTTRAAPVAADRVQQLAGGRVGRGTTVGALGGEQLGDARRRWPTTTTRRGRPDRPRPDRRGAGWSAKRVTEIRYGRPAATPASIAAPTSLTCTCTFQVAAPSLAPVADDDQRVAQRGQRRPQPRRPPRPAASSRYCTSYAYSAEPVSRATVSSRAGRARPSARAGPVPPRSPPRPARRAARTSPRPPASTTPARASAGSCSGVRASASAAPAAAARTTVAQVVAVRAARPRAAAAATTREHGALDRLGDRRVRRRWPPQRSAAASARPRTAGTAGERVGDAAQDLREDHPGVAPRAEQRAPGHQPQRVPVRGRLRRRGRCPDPSRRAC